MAIEEELPLSKNEEQLGIKTDLDAVLSARGRPMAMVARS